MLGATLGSPVPTLLRLGLPFALVNLVLAAACGGDDAPEATSTVVPVPTIPTAPPQVRDGGAGPTALALGPRYNETTLALLPVAQPFGVREVVEAIDANEVFEVRRFVSAGSDQPVVVGVCSPRAPDGVVLQTRHMGGGVATLFVWAYEDTSAIVEDWFTVQGVFRPLPPRPIEDFNTPGPPTPPPTPEEGEEPEPTDPESLCTTTSRATAGMIVALQHENLVIVLTEASPHPGPLYTSPGANAELLDVLRSLEAPP